MFVRVVDIEYGWLSAHEDFPSGWTQIGTNSSDLGWVRHGTATVGVVAAGNNGYGYTGIAFNTNISGDTPFHPFWSVAGSINRALQTAGQGDVILIEQQTGIGGPVEQDQAEFDAILNATNSQRIVIEPTGNGANDLDSASFGQLFQRTFRDSVQRGIRELSSRCVLAGTTR